MNFHHHLGMLRELKTGVSVGRNDSCNVDQTHFIINIDNGITLGFFGTSNLKYIDVVSGGKGFNLLLRLSGGNDETIEALFMIFKNVDRNYTIREMVMMFRAFLTGLDLRDEWIRLLCLNGS